MSKQYRIFSARELNDIEAAGTASKQDLMELIRGYRRAKHDGELRLPEENSGHEGTRLLGRSHTGRMARPVI